MLTATERTPSKTAQPAHHRVRPEPARAEAPPPSPLWQQIATRAQFKLAVSSPGDASEREAERWADSVVRSPQAAPCAGCAAGAPACERCRQPQVARRAAADAGRDATGDHPAALGSGQALDPATRAFMEPRVGHDFGGVRVHADRAADDSARAFDALAYTVGRDVVFRANHYAPHSEAGRQLLAHELGHVVQQRSLGPSVQREAADFRVTQVLPRPRSLNPRRAGLASQRQKATYAARPSTSTPLVARVSLPARRASSHCSWYCAPVRPWRATIAPPPARLQSAL